MFILCVEKLSNMYDDEFLFLLSKRNKTANNFFLFIFSFSLLHTHTLTHTNTHTKQTKVIFVQENVVNFAENKSCLEFQQL